MYNGEDFLRRSLESLLSQTFRDIEVIICDNASTDATRSICEEFAARDPRVVYRRNEINLGAARNYNLAFERARGEFFKWASHDDVCDPTYIERCAEAFDRGGSDVVLVYPRTIMIGPNEEELERFEDNCDLPSPDPQTRVVTLLRNLTLCNAVFGLIRAEPLRRTRLIGTYLASDRVLLAELALRGKFIEIPEALFRRRVHQRMSNRANRTDNEVAAWFDPANRDRILLPKCRLLAEHWRAVRDAGMTGLDRLVCTAWIAAIWTRQYWRTMGGEVKYYLIQSVRRRLASGGGRSPGAVSAGGSGG